MADLTPHGYADFLATLKQQIRQRQYQALRAVNRELVALYLQPLVREISCAKNLVILSRCKDDPAREFYLCTVAHPLGVGTYAVVPQLPENFKVDLPSPEQIAERLKAWDAQNELGENADET